MREVHISKRDVRVARVVEIATTPLGAGAARLRLDLFALSSNNVTYAAMGEGAYGYWDFFPGPEGWGRPPVWGFATVVASNAPGVEIGARYFGYFPIGETLDVTPVKIGARGFTDGASHRSTKASVYNQYLDTRTDSAYDAAFEAEQALLRTVYSSGWWVADCVHQGHPHTVLVSSASSKTALATAHQLRQLAGPELVALTSARNKPYVLGTGLYDRTMTYDEVSTLTAGAPATYVDFLGRGELIEAVHRTLGTRLARSILVGATDWSESPGELQPPKATLAGPAPEIFFVASYIPGRIKAERELLAAMQRDLRAFYAASRAFFAMRHATGVDAVLAGWARVAAGATSPSEGLVFSF
jgi:Protein of unknown function (DUF2855)